MHPYEMSTTLRERRKEDSIRLNYGSLYSVVESLAKRGLIKASESVQDGRRPARTVYSITDDGYTVLMDWLSELLSVPRPQFTDFEAALSLLGAMPVDEARTLLATRLRALQEADKTHQATDQVVAENVPRMFLLESDYQSAVRVAEIAFVARLIEQIDSGDLGGIELWRSYHQQRDGFSRQEISEIAGEQLAKEFGLNPN